MKGYQPYVNHLNALAGQIAADGLSDDIGVAITAALDGEGSRELRRLVDRKLLRASGAFFTDNALAKAAWQYLRPTLTSASVIADPTCGIGSLLLPGLKYLMALHQYPLIAAEQIRGLDIEQAFVDASRIRLYLTAISVLKNSATEATLSSASFVNVRQGDATADMNSALGHATHVVLNPPYGIRQFEGAWSTGTTSGAAVFAEACVKAMKDGSRVVAILPDVLRSGSRYTRWRDQIERMATVETVKPWGVFDAHTDIDVFILHLTKKSDSRAERSSNLAIGQLTNTRTMNDASQTVDSYFECGVGAVVPHRHLEEGPLRPFATAKVLPAWKTVNHIAQSRHFSGTCVTPPFVAVRRTTRPGQSPRAIATLIAGGDEVAVDNHLFALKPRDGRLETCRTLIDILRSTETTSWLDQNFRCRHLPVHAIRSIPWVVAESEG